VNGIWNKGVVETTGISDFEYDYKYLTTNIDLLVNLCTLFGKNDYYPWNVYLIGGAGFTYAWDNEDLRNSKFSSTYVWDKNKVNRNLHVGAMLDYNLNKHWSVNLEVGSNMNVADTWQLSAQVGVAYKFGFSRKIRTSPTLVGNVEEYVSERNAETASAKLSIDSQEKKVTKEAQKEVTEKAQPTTLHEDVFFSIGSSEIRASEVTKIKNIIKWLKENPEAKAIITGHADAGTGNPIINAKYASKRAEAVAKYMRDAGIDTNRLKVESKGDKVMPYGDNEKSRVAIIIANE
jgi:outer membrane protein OmpA-like peptidoglycan-associated protein